MYFVISIAFYLFSIILILACLKIKQPSRYLAALFISLVAEIILTGNAAGLIHKLNSQIIWLIIQSIFSFISLLLWFALKNPKLFDFNKPNLDLKKYPLLQRIPFWLLVVVLLIGYGIVTYLILTVPANNNDSMLVHLTRVGYWLQHGSFAPWDNLVERQIIYPYNARIVLLWSILFTKTDQFVGFLQFFSVLFTSLGIYCIAREISGNFLQSSIVAMFYLTFPQVILQASTTQDDLVITCFIVLGTLFFLRWFRDDFKQKTDLILAAISWMITLGIKPSAFYFFIGFAVFFLILIFVKKMKFLPIIQLALSFLFCFGLLSSFGYINNLIYYQNPLGPNEFVKSESGLFEEDLFSKLKVNALRFFYQFISLDGLPIPIVEDAQELKTSIVTQSFGPLIETDLYIKDTNSFFVISRMPGINEDYSWFGPVSFLLLIPAFIIGMIKFCRDKDLQLLFLITIPLIMLVSISILRPGWDPYQGRYFNPAIAILMPVSIYLLNPRFDQKIYILTLSIIASLITFSCSLFNDAKPLVTQASLYHNLTSTNCEVRFSNKIQCYLTSKLARYLPDKDIISSLNYIEKMTYSSKDEQIILEEFSKKIPAGSKIGLFLQTGDWEYPFFGRHFEYHLVPIKERQKINNANWLSSQKIEYLIIHVNSQELEKSKPGFIVLSQLQGSTDTTFWQIIRLEY